MGCEDRSDELDCMLVEDNSVYIYKMGMFVKIIFYKV